MEGFKQKFRNFMSGRYGVDELSRFSMVILLILLILSVLIGNPVTDGILIALLAVSYFRIFSRNVQKRHQENEKYLQIRNRLFGKWNKEKYMMEQRKEFHIYKCPNCRQKIRIPKRKGKLSITCPKCRTEFVKNTGRKKEKKEQKGKD